MKKTLGSHLQIGPVLPLSGIQRTGGRVHQLVAQALGQLLDDPFRVLALGQQFQGMLDFMAAHPLGTAYKVLVTVTTTSTPARVLTRHAAFTVE